MRRILPSNGLALAVLLLAVFACGFGSLLWGKLTAITPAGQDRIRIETEQWEQEQEATRPAKVFWAWAQRVTLAVTIALVTVAVVTVVWLYGIRRAVTIGADQRGLFPLLLGRASGAWVVYDPNRSPSAATAIGDGKPSVVHTLPDGIDQTAITKNAQSVQALAAIASGEGGGSRASELVTGVIGASHQLARPMPEVRKSPWESSHVERLLVESGELQESDYE